MREIVSEILINAPPETVFLTLTNFEAYPKFDTRIEKVIITSPQKRGVGVKTHWKTSQGEQSREWDETVVEWRDNEKYAYQIATREFPNSYTLKQTSKGTKLTYVMRLPDTAPNYEETKKRILAFHKDLKKYIEQSEKPKA